MSKGSLKTKTILACFPHADDEVNVVGTLLNHVNRGDKVILAWMTRGEMTSLFGNMPMEKIVIEREKHTAEVQRIIGCEILQLEFADAHIGRTHQEAVEIAKLVAKVRPDVIITWNFLRGHPDHRNLCYLLQDAVTYARLPRMIAPLEAHRPTGFSFYCYFDEASAYPVVYVDVSVHMPKIEEVLNYYAAVYKWDQAVERLKKRRSTIGNECGVKFAEKFNLLLGHIPSIKYLV